MRYFAVVLLVLLSGAISPEVAIPANQDLGMEVTELQSLSHATRWGTVYSDFGCKYLANSGLRLTGAGSGIPDGTYVVVIGILYYTSRCTGTSELTMKVEIIHYP